MTQIFKEADNHLVESLDELTQAALASLAAFFSDLEKKFTYTISIKNSVVLADGTKLNGGFQKVPDGTYKNGTPKFKNVNNKFLLLSIFLATDGGVVKKIEDVVIAPLNSIVFNPTASQLNQFTTNLPLNLKGTLQDVISAEIKAVTPVPENPQPPVPQFIEYGKKGTEQLASVAIKFHTTVENLILINKNKIPEDLLKNTTLPGQLFMLVPNPEYKP